MPSHVDLANMAILKVGHRPILTFDDASDTARTLKLLYQPTLDSVLRAHKWRFAVTQAGPLAADKTAPSWRYAARYQLPTDPLCLRVFRVNADENGNTWEVQGRFLYTDQAAPMIEYIGRIDNTNLFDSLFIEAFVERLAAEIAIPLTSTPSLQVQRFQAYQLKIQEARSTDGMEATPEQITSDILLEVR